MVEKEDNMTCEEKLWLWKEIAEVWKKFYIECIDEKAKVREARGKRQMAKGSSFSHKPIAISQSIRGEKKRI